jgi:hypothetical protein
MLSRPRRAFALKDPDASASDPAPHRKFAPAESAECQRSDTAGGLKQGRSCEGFRMPAGRDERAAPGPASESRQGRNPRGAGLGVEVYGDLTVGEGRGRGRRLARRRRSAAWSAGRSGRAWRNGRALAPRSAEVGAIGGPGRRIDRMRVRSIRRRRRGPAAGLRCEEGFSGVMRPRL